MTDTNFLLPYFPEGFYQKLKFSDNRWKNLHQSSQTFSIFII